MTLTSRVSNWWVELKVGVLALVTSSAGSILRLLQGINNFSRDLAVPTVEWEQDDMSTTWQSTWEAKGGDLQNSGAWEVLCEGQTQIYCLVR